MDFSAYTGIVLVVATCGGSTNQSVDYFDESGEYTCAGHQKIVDVELYAISRCQVDADCTQVLGGTGCGCSTDDRIAASGYDTSYFYDMVDEADRANCTLDFDTTCDCPVSATPVCVWGVCSWSN